MLRTRHVRRLLADLGVARHALLLLTIHSVAPSLSLSLPATAPSPLQAATYDFCRQNSPRRQIRHATGRPIASSTNDERNSQ